MLKVIQLVSLTLLGYVCQSLTHASPIAPHKSTINIKSLNVQYRTEESFHGIVEAFSRRESTAGRLFVRSNPQRREGLYFIVSVHGSIHRIPEGSQITIYFVTNLDPHAECHTWQLPSTKQHFSNTLYLGLTDKTYASVSVICWQVILSNAEGRPLGELHSFAWKMPGKRQ